MADDYRQNGSLIFSSLRGCCFPLLPDPMSDIKFSAKSIFFHIFLLPSLINSEAIFLPLGEDHSLCYLSRSKDAAWDLMGPEKSRLSDTWTAKSHKCLWETRQQKDSLHNTGWLASPNIQARPHSGGSWIKPRICLTVAEGRLEPQVILLPLLSVCFYWSFPESTWIPFLSGGKHI